MNDEKRILSFRIPEWLYELLVKEAKREMTGVSAVIRWAIKRYFGIEEEEDVPTRVQRQTEE